MNTADRMSGNAAAVATPELSRFVAELFASTAVPTHATLADLRRLLLGPEVFMAGDGELLYKLDRTAFLIEVDELIDRGGDKAPIKNLLV